MDDLTPLLNVAQVSKYLNVHEMTAYRWMKTGELPAFKVGGVWRARKESIDKYILKRTPKLKK